MNSNASIFKRVKVRREQSIQLISQKHGLPTNKTYLAVNWPTVSDSLFLTDEPDRLNRFKILRVN